MDKFYGLARFLSIEKRSDFYLGLKEIEELIGQPLSKSAYTYSAYWFPTKTHYSANLIRDLGFKVSPDLKNKRIRLMRIGTEKR